MHADELAGHLAAWRHDALDDGPTDDHHTQAGRLLAEATLTWQMIDRAHLAQHAGTRMAMRGDDAQEHDAVRAARYERMVEEDHLEQLAEADYQASRPARTLDDDEPRMDRRLPGHDPRVFGRDDDPGTWR